MKIIQILAIFLLSCPLFAQNATLHVNPNATGGQQNGLSWADAFTDLTAALSTAEYGDEIWVAQGTYYPTNTTDRNLSFELKNGVRLLGGFSGTEITADQRNPLLYLTRLSGNIGNPATKTDNAYHVLRGRGLDANTVLDGFTISNGYSIGAVNANSDSNGAGLYLVGSGDLQNARPIISNCIFEFNEAGGAGGGLFVSYVDQDDPFLAENLVNPILRNCTFDQNAADVFGGAICKEGPSGVNDSFLVEDCRFTRNYVYALDGGGIFFARANQSKIVLKRCLFESNLLNGGQGGGFCIPTYAPGGYTIDLVLDSCVFRKNRAPEGGGFAFDGQTEENPDIILNLQIMDCLFEENDAKNSDGGAFIVKFTQNTEVNAKVISSRFVKNRTGTFFTTAFLSYGDSEADITIEDCDFLGNIDLDNPSGYCAAFAAGGHKVNTRINNCLFANNGSALFAGGSEPSQVLTEVTNCTFYRNMDRPFGKRWYPSYNQAGSVYYNKMNFYNSVIWESEATIHLIDNNYPNQLSGSWFFFDYCAFHPINPAILPNAGQVFGDSTFFGVYPDFVDTTAGDFRLKTCSPVMNRGNNQLTQDAGLTADLDGNPRIRFDTVDLGAYETQEACISSLSAEPESDGLQAQLSPNPVQSGGLLNLSLEAEGPHTLDWALRDAYGRVLDTGRVLLAEKQHFSLTAPLVPGLYWLEMRAEGQSGGIKFVVSE